MTRYRPLHVQALFFGAVSPANDADYLYSSEGGFAGEGAALLRALGVDSLERGVEATLTDFQRRGFLLAHVLDCAEDKSSATRRGEALRARIPASIVRIRRSFRPKRLVLIGSELTQFIPQFRSANLDAALVLQDGKPFEWNQIRDGDLAKELATPLQSL
jgi:hypothetical protein